MRKLLLNQHNRTKEFSQLSLFFALLLLPMGVWGQTEYGLTVGGVEVTSANAENIIGDNIQGSVSFAPLSNTLTLDNATISGTTIFNGCIVSGLSSLNIVLKGNSTLDCSNDSCTAIRSVANAALTITKGEEGCSLAFKSYRVIHDFKTLNLTDLTWNDNFTYGLDNTLSGYDPGYRLMKGDNEEASLNENENFVPTLTAIPGYDLWIGDTQVTGANADDVLGDGKVSFVVSSGQAVATTYTLKLNGATITEPVKVGLPNLTFELREANTITTDEICIQNIATTDVPSLTFKTNPDIEGSLILTNNNGGISAIGENNISVSNDLAVLLTVYGEDDYTSNLYYITNGSTTVAKIVPSYGVIVNDKQVYAGNAADVFGDGTVSFDKTTNTLTLNNAYISGSCISTQLSNLFIELIGDNYLEQQASYAALQSQTGEPVTMTIMSSAAIKGSFEMHQPYTQAGTFYDDHVELKISEPLTVVSGSLTGNDGNNNTVVIGESYGITITDPTGNDYLITSKNRTNVLNDQEDPQVQFDGRNTLILDNADLAAIVLSAENVGVKTGLTIYLKGNNTVNNGEDALLFTGDDDMPLTFATGGIDPGTLSLSYTDEPLFCFNTTYHNNLIETLDGENHIMTITAAMIPLVTEEQKEQINEGEGKGLGEEIKDYIDQNLSGLSDAEVTGAFGQGITINKILYVLPHDNDGYLIMGDDNVLCLNSQMSDGTVEEVAQKLYDGDIIPGSEDFKNSFHGLCFLLPAGEGEIVLDVNTGATGELHVMVGIDEPVTITGKTEFETVTIPYLVDADTYVLIYSTANVVDASRVFDSHRAPGKKMMNTTTLKKVGVSARSVCSAPEPPVSPKMFTKSDMVAPILYGGQYTNFDMVKVEDTDVASIADDAFEGLTDVTCVDLSATGITGLTIDRDIKPWNYLPYSAFIYLPTGNKVKEGQQNVVIGDVCMNAELLEDNPFEITKDFTAKNIELKRNFKELEGKKCTIMLPFALDETTAAKLGTFYEMVDGGASDANDGKVHMETVAETIANWPYMFKPADIDFINLDMVKVEAATEAPEYTINGMTFKGCFEKTTIESNGSANYYCFVKDQFVRVIDKSVTVKTFRAYMTADAGAGSFSNTLDIDWGDGTTSIKNMKVGTDNNIYYDLQGRRVLYPQKGVYILNGKKIVIK